MADTDSGVSRRSLVQGSAVAVVAGVAGFVAFSARDDQPAVGTYGAGDSAGRGTQGDVLASLDEIPDGAALVVSDQQIVLVRSGDEVRAFSAQCTHQGCLLSGVRDGLLVCPCHGSSFDPATGDVVSGPARSALAPVSVAVSDGSVVRS